MEHESDGDTNRWRTWNRHQRIGKSTGSLRNQRIIREHQDYSITKISLNAEKSLRDLRYLSVKKPWANVGVKNLHNNDKKSGFQTKREAHRSYLWLVLFVTASGQTGLDTRSVTRMLVSSGG